jgi:hypothetical protein
MAIQSMTECPFRLVDEINQVSLLHAGAALIRMVGLERLSDLLSTLVFLQIGHGRKE